MKVLAGILFALIFGTGLFLFSGSSETMVVHTPEPTAAGGGINVDTATTSASAGVSLGTVVSGGRTYEDAEYQRPLPNYPAVIKGVYATGWSAGSAAKLNYFINLAKETEINAVVVDIKDYSGYVSYVTGIPEIRASGAEGDIKISQPNLMIRKFHEAGIYVIGRITVFQDPVLAKAHPEWALKDKITGKIWTDNKGLAWMDPASKDVWNYNVAVAKDAIARGFDEINFDYIRFASDGNMENIVYPSWSGKTPRSAVISDFFSFLRSELGGAKISADLFGLSTINRDDLGIGQVIESAYKYFDYVCPMVYPSHYASGFLGYANPAKYPYEVVKYSMEHALARLKGETAVSATSSASSSSTSATTTPDAPVIPQTSGTEPDYRSKLRPWLQDFNLGAVYDASMVRAQIKAVEETLNSTSSSEYFAGWFLWNPSNNYTKGALNNE
ncbi:MAG: putative glycoside hydrolase [Patescibacteria group bacterium]